MITVKPVTSKSDWDAFKKVPQTVYLNDPHWIPDNVIDLDALLINPKPKLRHRSDTQAYIAYNGATAVGRVVAIADHRYNEYHQDCVAFFGFYEAIKSDAVAFGLLDAVEDWARCRSLTHLYGPVNPSMEYSVGVLINGGGHPALVGMPYNPEYYADHLGRWGMHKVKDLHSHLFQNPHTWLTNNRRFWERWHRSSSVTFRSLDLRRFEQEVETVRQIYNSAFVRFWGFTPLDREDFLDLANSFRPILDEDLVVFAELDQRPVGFLMVIPDVNQALMKAGRWRNGLVRNLIAFWHWKGPGRRHTMRHARVDMLMVHPDCPNIATAGLLILETLRRIHDKGYSSFEAAPVLEGSAWLRSLRDTPALEPRRTYRVYGRELDTEVSCTHKPFGG